MSKISATPQTGATTRLERVQELLAERGFTVEWSDPKSIRCEVYFRAECVAVTSSLTVLEMLLGVFEPPFEESE